MGFFDLFNAEEESKEVRKDARDLNRETDTEFARDEASIRLHEEELDINKSRVETGEVVLDKDVIEEQKVVDVPLSHDQVVIEKKSLGHESTSESITDGETIHIPLTAETVEVGKHTVVTDEITARKRSVEETQHVDEVLHREVADIKTEGNADIIDE
ncbi:YsnF/AvaK domain-containing protein [Bacillus solitudinis]|uniref:YsnF/AvaK domain-containing protein n=1 Tax=Bacillus solitudinis TaxID=2014074 RepID=UPI000C2403CC|nr:YsnF/AvaK domain-containing protein [Bacillus solitudinis]